MKLNYMSPYRNFFYIFNRFILKIYVNVSVNEFIYKGYIQLFKSILHIYMSLLKLIKSNIL